MNHTQSLSNMITVSAAVKFKPSPPARVDINIKKQSGSLVNVLIASTLSAIFIVPSNLVYSKERKIKNSSIRSNNCVIVENSNTYKLMTHYIISS